MAVFCNSLELFLLRAGVNFEQNLLGQSIPCATSIRQLGFPLSGSVMWSSLFTAVMRGLGTMFSNFRLLHGFNIAPMEPAGALAEPHENPQLIFFYF